MVGMGGGLDIYSNFRFISSSIKLENVKFTRNISSWNPRRSKKLGLKARMRISGFQIQK